MIILNQASRDSTALLVHQQITNWTNAAPPPPFILPRPYHPPQIYQTHPDSYRNSLHPTTPPTCGTLASTRRSSLQSFGVILPPPHIRNKPMPHARSVGGPCPAVLLVCMRGATLRKVNDQQIKSLGWNLSCRNLTSYPCSFGRR